MDPSPRCFDYAVSEFWRATLGCVGPVICVELVLGPKSPEKAVQGTAIGA